MDIPMLVAAGFALGAIGTFMGAGGGFLLVPWLLLGPRLDNAVAAGTSLFVVLLNAASGATSYARQRRIDYGTGALFAAATVPGAILGARVAPFVADRPFRLAFAAVLAAMAAALVFGRAGGQTAVRGRGAPSPAARPRAVGPSPSQGASSNGARSLAGGPTGDSPAERPSPGSGGGEGQAGSRTVGPTIGSRTVGPPAGSPPAGAPSPSTRSSPATAPARPLSRFRVRRRLVDARGDRHEWTVDVPLGVAVSLAVGFLSSLLGIGGGIIHVPLLVALLAYPPHVATATSHFILVFTALAGVLAHWLQGTVDIRLALPLGLGAVLGAPLGAWLSHRSRPRWVMIGLGLALLAVALRLVLTPA